MLIVETPRLILRPFQEDDIMPFAAYRSAPEVALYQSWETPYTREQAAEFVREMQRAQPGAPAEWYQFAIERKRQAGLIGDCAFHTLAEEPRQAEIGFTLSPQFQRQGYATEAVGGLLKYAFEIMKLHRVTAQCDTL